ncbi:MAG: winged helix-turn-helix domain-containing protein [Chitinophagales bacterium]
MAEVILTRQQARRFLLAQQSLWPPHQLKGKSGILSFIRRVGCIQFDPLNIVGRNPELVLQARVSDFRPAMLEELLYEDRKLLDGWDKMMAIYSTEDWPYFQRHREAARRRLSDTSRPIVSIVDEVRAAISEHGPQSSLDLPYQQTVDWPWAPTRLSRAALESMYFCGELVIDHKVHTRKVYDLASRHLSPELLSASDPNRTEEEYHDWHVLRRIGGVGLLWARSGDAWLGMPGIKSKERRAALLRLQSQGKIIKASVEGIEQPLYLRSEDSLRLESVLKSGGQGSHAVILAPLDNLLWDRRLVKELFAFDYRWEVYKPSGDRRYGYYVLPVLLGDRFIARFEPGRDRKNKALTIKKWWWEPGIRQSKWLRSELIDCFERFLKYLGSDTLRIEPETLSRADLEWLNRVKKGHLFHPERSNVIR